MKSRLTLPIAALAAAAVLVVVIVALASRIDSDGLDFGGDANGDDTVAGSGGLTDAQLESLRAAMPGLFDEDGNLRDGSDPSDSSGSSGSDSGSSSEPGTSGSEPGSGSGSTPTTEPPGPTRAEVRIITELGDEVIVDYESQENSVTFDSGTRSWTVITDPDAAGRFAPDPDGNTLVPDPDGDIVGLRLNADGELEPVHVGDDITDAILFQFDATGGTEVSVPEPDGTRTTLLIRPRLGGLSVTDENGEPVGESDAEGRVDITVPALPQQPGSPGSPDPAGPPSGTDESATNPDNGDPLVDADDDGTEPTSDGDGFPLLPVILIAGGAALLAILALVYIKLREDDDEAPVADGAAGAATMHRPLDVFAGVYETDAEPEPRVWRDPFEDLLDTLLAEPDVALAICRAYSLVDGGRIDRRLRRGPEELPDAFAIRGGGIIEDARALYGLTDLYQEARFSGHAMAPAQRETAIALLRSLRREAGEHAVDVAPLVSQP